MSCLSSMASIWNELHQPAKGICTENAIPTSPRLESVIANSFSLCVIFYSTSRFLAMRLTGKPSFLKDHLFRTIASRVLQPAWPVTTLAERCRELLSKIQHFQAWCYTQHKWFPQGQWMRKCTPYFNRRSMQPQCGVCLFLVAGFLLITWQLPAE